MLILFLVNFSFGFGRALERPAWACQPVTAARRAYPVENPYYNAVRQVVGDLGRKIQGTSGLVYVVGDDEGLSPELLKRSFLPEEVDAAPFVMVNNIVDLRDGFPSQLFLADYVLLSDPFKTSFPAAQQVSYQVYEMLRDDPGLEHCYQLDAAYEAVDRKYLL